MTDLLDPKLSPKKFRNLLRLKDWEIDWDNGTNASSEWVVASFDNVSQINVVKDWLSSKAISNDLEVLISNSFWQDYSKIKWGDLIKNVDEYLTYNNVFIASSDRKWIIEYNPIKVIRFGRWKSVD